MKLIVGPVASGKSTKVIELAKESAWDMGEHTLIITNEYGPDYVEGTLSRLYGSEVGLDNLTVLNNGDQQYDIAVAYIVCRIIAHSYGRILIDCVGLGDIQLKLISEAEQYSRMRGNGAEIYVTRQTNRWASKQGVDKLEIIQYGEA